MTTDPFADELRAMLQRRADDIDAVPATLDGRGSDLDDDVLTLAEPAGAVRRSRSGTRRTWMLAAAAVVALGGAGTALTVDRSTQPTDRGSTGATAPAAVTECPAALPDGWGDLRDGLGIGYRATDTPLAVRRDGAVLVARDADGTRSVQLLDGAAPRTVLRLRDGSRQATFGAFVGGLAVLGLTGAPRDGGETPLMQIVVVELATSRTVSTLTTMTEQDLRDGGRWSDTVAVAGDRVLWDTRPRRDSRSGTVRAYDLSSGRTTTVTTGPRVRLRTSAAGVLRDSADGSGPLRLLAATPVPAAVLTATDPAARTTLATDGTRWAWYSARDRRLGWYDGTRLRWVTRATVAPAPGGSAPLAVAGRYVFVRSAGRWHVVDTAGGATAALPRDIGIVGGAGTRVVTGIDTGRTGGFIGRVDTTRLPAPTC